MPKPKKTAPERTKTEKASDDEAATGSQAAYELFLPRAVQLAAGDVQPMKADPVLAYGNVVKGVASVLGVRARAAKLPETDVDAIAALPELALAVVFASTQVSAPEASGLGAKFAEAYPLRTLLLTTADALAAAGLVSAAAVAKIRAGRGKLDAATDLVALAALFTKSAAAIKGKHAVTAKQVQRASTLGTDLLKALKPARAKPGAPAASVGAAERDRLWTLLVQGYDQLWRAGAYLFGKDAVDAKVPPLLSGRRGRPKAQPAPPPAS